MQDRRLIREVGFKSESRTSRLVGVLYRDSLLYFIGYVYSQGLRRHGPMLTLD